MVTEIRPTALCEEFAGSLVSHGFLSGTPVSSRSSKTCSRLIGVIIFPRENDCVRVFPVLNRNPVQGVTHPCARCSLRLAPGPLTRLNG